MPAPRVTSPARLSPFSHPQLKGELRLTPFGLQQWDGGNWVPAMVPSSSVDLSDLATGQLTVSKIKVGGGGLGGTNYVSATNNVAAESHPGNSTWLTVGFDTILSQVADDGLLYTAGQVPFAVPATGLWLGTVALPYASTNTTGYRGVRWIDSTGVILSQPPLVLASAPSGYMVTAMFAKWLTAGLQTVHVETFSSAGSSVSIVANAPITPNAVTFARIA